MLTLLKIFEEHQAERCLCRCSGVRTENLKNKVADGCVCVDMCMYQLVGVGAERGRMPWKRMLALMSDVCHVCK